MLNNFFRAIEIFNRKKPNIVIYTLLIIASCIYIINAWSPSSYSIVLNSLGIHSSPDLGVARDIRSDEYWVQTPLTQALVNNGFHRFNDTSVYNEDLRINYGLPIFDWGLIFKPAQWGYYFLPPVYAFSLYYCFLFVAFLLGYKLFFEKMGLNSTNSFMFSISLLFSGAIQAWWTVNAPTFVFFPWVFICLLKIKDNIIYSLFLFYSLVCWQFGNLYPAFTYALILAGGCWLWYVLDWKTLKLKHYIFASLAGGAAVVTVFFYFYDYMMVMKDTVYPGLRNINGGSFLTYPILFSFFVPGAWFDHHYNILIYKDATNICEISALATILPLMLLFFTKKSVVNFKGIFKGNIPIIIIASVILVWCVFPVPASIGKYLYLNNIIPNRLLLGLGLIVSIISIKILINASFLITPIRLFAFWIVYIILCIFIKINFRYILLDLAAASAAFIAMYFLLKRKSSSRSIIIGGCTIFSVISFGLFNPLQDSHDIFSHPSSASIGFFNKEQEQYGYVFENVPGSVLNGLGFKSVTHVLTTPQLNFWKKKFPYLNHDDFLSVFNRYAHIHLTEDESQISTPHADVISVPKKCFESGLYAPCKDVYVKK